MVTMDTPEQIEWMRCPTCHGSGLLPDVDNAQQPCPTCNEDGEIDREMAHLLGVEFEPAQLINQQGDA